jgi:hypothetical protein
VSVTPSEQVSFQFALFNGVLDGAEQQVDAGDTCWFFVIEDVQIGEINRLLLPRFAAADDMSAYREPQFFTR